MDNDLLASYGIDCAKGIKNCMGDEAFYKKMLKLFLSDTCFARAKEAQKKDDPTGVFEGLHELKGVAGNTGLTGLYNAVIPILDMLRGDRNNIDKTVLAELFSKLETMYMRTCEGIGLVG